MTRLLGVLAMALAVGGVGCASNGWNHDASANNSNDMSSGNMAQPMSNDSNQPNGPSVVNDQQFVADAGAGGMYEVQAGKLAEKRSQDNQVKSIAKQMVSDHTAANNELTSLAKSKGIHVPSGPNSDQQNMLARLKGLQGTQFDREYLTQQDQAHHTTISLFQTEASSGTDADLRQFASKTLPTLQHHLQMIQGAEGSGNMGMSNGR